MRRRQNFLKVKQQKIVGESLVLSKEVAKLKTVASKNVGVPLVKSTKLSNLRHKQNF